MTDHSNTFKSWMAKPVSGAPPAARWLSLTGVLPFIVLALLVVVTPSALAVNRGAYGGLIAYSAVILSFLGATRWGAELASRPDAPRWSVLGLAVAPALWAWLTISLALSARGELTALIAGFLAMLAWDLTAAARGVWPRWYPALRIIASAGAVASLLLVVVTR